MMNKLKVRQWAMFVALIALATISRALPHPPNFTPIGGMALFAGAIMPHLSLAILLPLSALVIGDYLYLGGNYDGSWIVYLSFVMITLLGRFTLKSNTHPYKLLGSSLLASTFFFLTTNLEFWYNHDTYSHNWQGFLTCLTMAIPFFGNTISGDIFFTAFFFASWYYVNKPVHHPSTQLPD
jgi:hypothetical protein